MITVILRGEPEGRLQPQPKIVRRKRDGKLVPILFPAPKTKRYQRALAMQAKVVMGSRPLFTGALVVVVRAVMGVPNSWSQTKRDKALAGIIRPTGKPDWDNFAKQLDAFKNVVWTDDASVVDGRVIKKYGEEPLLWIEVDQLPWGELERTEESKQDAAPCDSLTSPGPRPRSNTL